MTLYINIGRRLPRSYMRRQTARLRGFLAGQEQMWIMIKQSLIRAKKAANKDGRMKFVMTYPQEFEDMNYMITWIKIVIQGKEELEKEEEQEAMMLYKQLKNILKKEMPKDERFSKRLKSKLLNPQKIDEAYEKGFGMIEDNNLANKLLEMGIMTHIERIDDYNTRDEDDSINYDIG